MNGASVALECALRLAGRRPGRVLATVVAVAVGVAGLMLVAAATTIAGDLALQRGVTDIDAVDRAFTASAAPDLVPDAAELVRLDKAVRSRLNRRGLGTPIRTVEYRSLAAGDGRDLRVAGLDDLQHVARLTVGNWPTRCDAQRCEVVALLPAARANETVAPLPASSTLGLMIVGTAVSTSDLVLSGQLRPDDSELILVADGVSAASGLPPFALIRRSYAWQAPVVPAGLRAIDIDSLLRGVRAISSDPQLTGLVVSGPERELFEISGRTHVTTNRLAVPIGALLVLFLGVAVVAGLGGRADHQRAAALLQRRGAGRSVLVWFRAVEALIPVVAGLVLGATVAMLGAPWLGRRASLGGWNIVTRSFDRPLIERVLLIGVALWLLIFLISAPTDNRVVGFRRIRPFDVVGLASLGVLGVLTARGAVSAASLGRGVDPALVAVPLLAAAVLAATVNRIVPLILRFASRAVPRRRPLTKLTLAEAVAQPLRSIATASLIAVTVMFALLTFGYAATLRVGARDQAAFAVPFDFRLKLGASLIRPQALMSTGGWSVLASGTTETDVLRRGVSVRQSATTTQTVEVIGLDPATLGHLHGWRSSFGPSPDRLATMLVQPPPPIPATALPADATAISFHGSGFDGLQTSAVIRRVDGTWHEITLDNPATDGAGTALTPGDAGGQLIGFRVGQPADVSARIEHHVGEGDTSEEARPVEVVLRSVTVAGPDGRETAVLLKFDTLRAAQATTTVDAGSALHVTGSILGQSILVTPIGPDRTAPLNAVVDPVTARSAINGVVAAETSSGQVLLHPVAVAERFPGADARFAVVDITTLQPALDLLQPGAGTANELWLAADSPVQERRLAAGLTDHAFTAVDVDRRAARQATLDSDPLANVTLAILVASAVVAALLGACAVILGAASAAHDDRPLLRNLALERVRGSRLARVVAGKSLAVICLAVPLGLIGGRWLLRIATRLVTVSATSSSPIPPLRLVVPWVTVLVLSLGLMVVLAGAAAWGAASARRVPHEDLLRGTT